MSYLQKPFSLGGDELVALFDPVRFPGIHEDGRSFETDVDLVPFASRLDAAVDRRYKKREQLFSILGPGLKL